MIYVQMLCKLYSEVKMWSVTSHKSWIQKQCGVGELTDLEISKKSGTTKKPKAYSCLMCHVTLPLGSNHSSNISSLTFFTRPCWFQPLGFAKLMPLLDFLLTSLLLILIYPFRTQFWSVMALMNLHSDSSSS